MKHLLAIVITISISCNTSNALAHVFDDSSSVEACEMVLADTSTWHRVSCRYVPLTFLLPPGFVEKVYDIRSPDWEIQHWRSGFDLASIAQIRWIELSVEGRQADQSLEQSRVYGYAEGYSYSQCITSISRIPVLIQAGRRGNIVTPHGSWPSYVVDATFQLNPGVFVRVKGSATNIDNQRLLLAIINTFSAINNR